MTRPPTAFSVGAVLQQLVRPADHGELGLELTDPSPGLRQLDRLLRGDAWSQTSIDAVLIPPAVDRLIRHTERIGDLSHRATIIDQIQHLAT